VLPAHGELTTFAAHSLGGTSVSVYSGDTLLVEGFATTLDLAGPRSPQGVAEVAEPAEAAPLRSVEEVDAVRWDPSSGETVAQRLRAIVSETMGYDADDLPDELPLIDLGLDSLMGMRIKNRVENDFQIPPLQVQTLRDASVADVVRIVEQAVAGNSGAPQPRPDNSPTRDVASEVAKAEAAGTTGVGVAPRDASERM
ncbi:ACP domain-containing protein, partial [Corynebacterium sanguinis]